MWPSVCCDNPELQNKKFRATAARAADHNFLFGVTLQPSIQNTLILDDDVAVALRRASFLRSSRPAAPTAQRRSANGATWTRLLLPANQFARCSRRHHFFTVRSSWARVGAPAISTSATGSRAGTDRATSQRLAALKSYCPCPVVLGGGAAAGLALAFGISALRCTHSAK